MDIQLLVRPSEAAVLLSASRSLVYRMLKAGELPSIRLGSEIRIPRAALEDWIARSLADGDSR